MRCTQGKCRRPARGPLCREHWGSMCRRIETTIRSASKAYIGRTNWPRARLEEHFETRGLTELTRLYHSEERRHIEVLETALIREFDDFYRLDNRVIDSRGRWGAGTQWIYIAWRPQ